MKILQVKYLTGPNFYSYVPTIWIEIDIGELEEKPSHLLPGFSEALLEVMPTLKSHTCSEGHEGGFVKRLKRGTWMAHILEHIAIEIQILAGIQVSRGKTIMATDPGVYYVTYDFQEAESGLFAFEAAMQIVDGLLKGQKDISVRESVEKTEKLYYTNKLGPSTEAIYKAARNRKIPVERIGADSLLRLGTGSKQKFMQATISSQTSHLAVENSCDKQLTKRILLSAGIPVPEGEVISNEKQLLEAADRLDYPLVIKPLDGRQGQGVITNLKNEQELLESYHCLKESYERFIIERYYNGEDYRFLIVNGELVAVSLRMPPYVIGNGNDSIRSLIEKENRNPLRGSGHEKSMSQIPLNDSVKCYLESKNLSLETVISKGRVIEVLGNANLSTGGLAINVTEQVHPSYRRIAVQAAKAIDLDIAGIDMIIKDSSAEYKKDHAAVLEVNAAPGIRMHHYPSLGKAKDAGGAIVDYLFKDRNDAAIPVIAITGTNGKTTTTRLVSHLLKENGVTVGQADSEGILIGDACIDRGDCSGPGSARSVLGHPEVDIAVLETARGGILRKGLAFDYCNVGIVTNVDEDHIGLDGIETLDELRKVKRLIPEVVIKGGSCILNADDKAVADMASFTDGEVIYTSLSSKNPYIDKIHIEKGIAWYIEESWIVLYLKGKKYPFMQYKNIPVTVNGWAKHNISNLLQALAAAHSMGVSFDQLRKRVMSFYSDFENNRGRFNILQSSGRTILIDYAHNASGLQAMYDAILEMNYNRVITVLSAPGNRLDREIRRLAEVAAKQTDYLIIKEDADLRGRKRLEIAHMMREIVLKNGLAPGYVSVIPDEEAAFEKAWEGSKEGDLLILSYEQFDSVKNFLKNLQDSSLLSVPAKPQ
jgi:cyanophycin synthetase